MSHEVATIKGNLNEERCFTAPLRIWEFVFLFVFAAGIIGAACWQSSKSYLSNDELVTAVVVSNPHFSEMWNAIRHGGELNPPLFFVIEWVVAQTLGSSDLALRIIPVVSLALAGWVLFFTLRPLTGPRIAAVAVTLILGLSRELFHFLVFARYYGVLLMLVSCAGFLALRVTDARPRRRDCFLTFLVYLALAYLHLYGLLYGGAILAAMLVADCFRGTTRWRLYASVMAAWLAFAPWVPSMRQQLKSISGGVYTPPGYLDLGFFFDDIALQTPLAVVILLIAALAVLSLLSPRPTRITEEAKACSDPLSWRAMGLIALALMAVPCATWTASHFLNPPPYMTRYNFPILAGWVYIFGLILAGLHRLPRMEPETTEARVPAAEADRISKGARHSTVAWLCILAWLGVLAFCMFFQPVRALKSPPRPATPFVDADFGYTNLPVIFENSLHYLPRAWYGHGREYALIIDHDAAEADPGWYTKNMDREFKAFAPKYDKLVILRFDNLPDWPSGFLAVDDDYTKTWEWIFAHHVELKPQLLGTRMCDQPLFGQQRVYLVRKASEAADKAQNPSPN